MKLPIISENKSLNFLCWFTYIYAILFTTLFLLAEIKPIETFILVLMLPLLTFGTVALLAPYIFLPLVIIPIFIEFFLIKQKKLKRVKPTIKNFLSTILISLTMLIILGFYIIGYYSIPPKTHKIYKKPNEYSNIIKNIEDKDGMSHFPKTIPEDASSIQIWGYIGNPNGEVVLLKFQAKKDFIKNELKKHKFLNSKTPVGTKQKIYHMFSDNGRITSEGYTFYVLDKSKNCYPSDSCFPYFDGIAVDIDLEHILYYHIVPND